MNHFPHQNIAESYPISTKSSIKEGILPNELGHSINKAFELRQEGDYREYVDLTYEQVEPFIQKAKVFVQSIRDYLQKTSLAVERPKSPSNPPFIQVSLNSHCRAGIAYPLPD